MVTIGGEEVGDNTMALLIGREGARERRGEEGREKEGEGGRGGDVVEREGGGGDIGTVDLTTSDLGVTLLASLMPEVVGYHLEQTAPVDHHTVNLQLENTSHGVTIIIASVYRRDGSAHAVH